MFRWFYLGLLVVGCATAAEPKNIILMIGDGMGPAQISAYHKFRKALDGGDGPFDRLQWVGKVHTDPASAPTVTDSAAAATAYGCGFKTYNGAICVRQDKSPGKPLFVRAAERGMATGVVVTSQINHATPAAFAAVAESRSDYQGIARQYVEGVLAHPGYMDVMLGGGWRYFERQPSLIPALRKRGYRVVTNSREIASYQGKSPILGLFDDKGLQPYLDRKNREGAVNLPMLLETALARMASDEDGFVLLVEGSQIDWAAHDNDVLDTMWETHEFALAIEKAVAFASARGDTLVLVTADHETGGMSLGQGARHEWDPSSLTRARMSARTMVRRHKEGESWKSLFAEQGVADLPAFRTLLADETLSLADLNRAYDEATATGWTTDSHTAVDVDLLAFGTGSEAFRGVWENDALGRALIRWVEAKDFPESER